MSIAFPGREAGAAPREEASLFVSDRSESQTLKRKEEKTRPKRCSLQSPLFQFHSYSHRHEAHAHGPQGCPAAGEEGEKGSEFE